MGNRERELFVRERELFVRERELSSLDREPLNRHCGTETTSELIRRARTHHFPRPGVVPGTECAILYRPVEIPPSMIPTNAVFPCV